MPGTSVAGSNAVQSASRHGNHGFTLIELLVVLAVIAMSLAIVGPRIVASIDSSRLNTSLRSVLTSARAARMLAQTEQREVSLVFDVADRSYRLDDDRVMPIRPRDTILKVTAAESERLSDSRIAIIFFPDGSASGGRVQFGPDERPRVLEIDWLTGFAQVDR